MEKVVDTAARLTLLESRAAIADVVHGYAFNIRSGNAAACEQLFTEDAVFEVRERGGGGITQLRSKLTSRSAIIAYLTEGSSSLIRLCPLIQNLMVRVNGREATSTSAMIAYVLPNGKGIIGEYEDNFRYEERWRFCYRIYTILGEVSNANA
jgi:SnoaL-like domain